MLFRGDWQWTWRFCFHLLWASFNRNCTSLIVYEKVLWTQWRTLTCIMPPTGARALLICQCWENTLFSRVSSFPDTSTIAHQNPNLQRLCLCSNSLNWKSAIFKLKSSLFLLTEIMYAFRLYSHIHTGVHAVPPDTYRLHESTNTRSTDTRARSPPSRPSKPWHPGPRYNYKARERVVTKRSQEESDGVEPQR